MDSMQLSYTCIRCVRAINGGQATRHGSKVAQIASGARKLSSKAKSTPSNRSVLSKIERDAFREPKRTAATATAAARRDDDNFERHNQLLHGEPPQYGMYRPSIKLTQDNLFHPFSQSPMAEMRERDRLTRENAYCPHPHHYKTREPSSPNDPESRKQNAGAVGEPPAHVSFECPDCGIATYCSQEHWEDDYESHLEICETLRQINEDDHDLRSGRYFSEFEYPGPQLDEILVNLTSWDTALVSEF
jgi:mitochondrial splicing suppressor protein 51